MAMTNAHRKDKESIDMTIKNVLENVNAIKEIAEATQNLDLKEKIIDLKEQVLELREENLKLKVRLREQEQFNMVFDEFVYWNEKGEEKDGPYCPVCWDNNQKAIRLTKEDNYVAGIGRLCRVCDKVITTN